LSVNEKSPNFIVDGYHLIHNSTRAAIIDSLYKRQYIQDISIQATKLGIKTIETLNKYCELIIDEELTRHFEKELEDIRKGKKDEEEVLEEAKKTLDKIFKKFKENEEKIGKNLLESHRITQEEMNTFGECPKCKTGNLKILFSRKTKSKFVGCSHYPNCKNIYSLPRNGLIKKIEERCKECNFYQVLVIRAGKRPWKLCLTPNCKSKEAWAKPFVKKDLPEDEKEKTS
jgi:DNA topoisomerase-1